MMTTPLDRIRELREKGITLYPNLTPQQRRSVLFIEEEPEVIAINPLQEQLDQMTAAYNAEVKKGQVLLKQRDLAIGEAQGYASYCDSLLMDITGNVETDNTIECSTKVLEILKLLKED